MSNAFIVFFSIFFTIFFSVNYYVFRHFRSALNLYPKTKKYFSWFFWFLPFSFVAGRILENWFINFFSSALIWIGSIWLGALAYFVLFYLIFDIVRLILKIFKIQPIWFVFDEKNRFKIGIMVVILVFIIVIGGIINVFYPVTKTLDISIPKRSLKNNKTIRMLVVSDIHLGTLVGEKRFEKLVETVNITKPDIVLFAGDIVDEDVAPVIKNDMGDSLLKIKPPLGFYGITGNHEYIGGVESSVDYLTKNGIKILRDNFVLIDNSFYLVGREDKSSDRMGGKSRKNINELFEKIPNDLPIILLDHQPWDLKSVAELNRVDLQISGHTHNGQLWPFNYIVKMIYEIAYGYGKIANTHFYVSNGYGTWGPPLRVGNRPEIVIMNINFE